MDRVGCAIAYRITQSLLGLGIPYETISGVVYSEIESIAQDQEVGDWIVAPDGTTWELTYKPQKVRDYGS